MSVRVLSRVFAYSETKLATRLVLLALADAAHDDGVAFPSQRKLAAKTRLSVSQVERSVRDLVAEGEIEVRKAQKGQRRINVYRVTLATEQPVYEDLPFKLSEPFSTTPQSDGSSEGDDPANTTGTTPQSAGSRARTSKQGSTNRKEIRNPPGGELALAAADIDGRTDAQKLVAFFVDEARERGINPPKRTKATLAKYVKEILDEGNTPRQVALGIRRMLDRRIVLPAQLGNFVVEANLPEKPKETFASQAFAKARAARLQEENG